jgi:GT2 family glycosyltransferase
MSNQLSEIGPPTTSRPSWLDAFHRRTGRVRLRWRTLMPLIVRSVARVGAAKGARGKLQAIRYLVARAHLRLRRRAAVASAQSTMMSVRLSDFVPPAQRVPECRNLGGGMLAIALPVSQNYRPRVTIRDKFGVTHTARQIDRIKGQIAHEPEAGAAGVPPVEASRERSPPTVQIVVQAPPELFETMTADVEVRIQEDSAPLGFKDVQIDNRPGVSISQITVENDLVMFSGTAEHAAGGKVTLGLFVDGHLSSAIGLSAQGSGLNGAIFVDPAHLDGAFHLLELRELPGMSLVASSHEFLPMHVTPWDALQNYARAPLDGTLAPAARHHFRSYQLWLDKVAEQGREIPPIGRLHHELLQGHKKRRDYPLLNFPVYERPVASVIVPAHNKFEVTYLCLCSLLFAYNDASFEVIVVDDGSSDETLDIDRFAKGIRVLRHEKAEGFVNACNDGAKLARGEFVVFLNNDTEATARWLDELVFTFRNFDNVGLAGSKLVYPDGKLQEAGCIIWGNGNPWNVGRGGNSSDPRYNYLRQADYVSGAALMLRRDVWADLGGFGEEYAPGYFEDTDLAMKVRHAGLTIAYVPTSTIIHFEGKSSGTDTAAGMKRYQEINRPKFKEKWGEAVAGHGVQSHDTDREKDRSCAFRVLFLDHQFPMVDGDAGSYAAFQEIRLLQSLGAKVTFLPRNLAWMDRHTLALQRIGAECLYAPFVTNYASYIRTHAHEFDAVFVCRYQIAEFVIPLVRESSATTKIIFNLADLHFLREMREAEALSPGATLRKALATREREMAVIQASDLTLSYTDEEIALINKLAKRPTALARLPWVSECKRLERTFAGTKDILFLGGHTHVPNIQAARFFAADVMPRLRDSLPGVCFRIIGKGMEDVLSGLESDSVHVTGYVADLDEAMAESRVFVAPLLAGAGLKGKVVEAVSRGLPSVLSTVAAEGTGLTDGESCLTADTVQQWVDGVSKLYTDEALWNKVGESALRLAETRFAFARGVDEFESALSKINISGRRDGNLVYRHARPVRYGL